MNTQNVPMIVVCDGIGGHNAGDVASAYGIIRNLGKRWEEESITELQKPLINGSVKKYSGRK